MTPPLATSAQPSIDFTATHVHREWKHTAPLIGCRCDPTGRYIFASGMDSVVQRWDLETDQHASMGGHESWLRAIGFTLDGSRTFTGGYDGKLCVWETAAEQLQPLREVAAHAGWIRAIAVSPDGQRLATCGNDLLVKIWSIESAELIQTLTGHQKHVYSLLFHPTEPLLLSGDLNGVVHQWDLASGQSMRSIDAKELYIYHDGQQVDYGGVRSMALSRDGKELACGGLHKGTNPFAGVQEPLVLVFDWETGARKRTHEATEIERGIVWRLHYEPDGTLLGASGGGSGGFFLHWREGTTEVHKFKLPNTILDMDPHRNEVDLVTAHHDGAIRINRMAKCETCKQVG